MMDENKKRLVASALSILFAMSFLTANVFASSGSHSSDDSAESAVAEAPADNPASPGFRE